MTEMGHNEKSYRLDAIAERARKGLENKGKGEELTIAGWLAYGLALNEGRALFKGDREFGEWIALCQLDTADGSPIDRHDRAAAMWAAANADQFEEARQRGNPRTIRGIHAKWKEIEKEREEAAWAAEQAERAANDEAYEKVMGQIKPASDLTPEIPDEVDAYFHEDQSAKEVKPATGHSLATSEQRPTGPSLAHLNQAADEPAEYDDDVDDLTEEALKEEVRGLRIDLEEAEKTITNQKRALEYLQEKYDEATQGDQGATISRLHNQVAILKRSADEAKIAAKRMEYRMKKAIEERDRAVAELQNQVITL
ncbi:hypothetical protein [Aestuariivita boseongensis]|uniref:hypothetical protein n=1 Tax=Aestuariivita boseongensis TaxID=1470562 RepID=UPI00067FFABC|nr:hypothetical protein [Aestuariivita boseongensis]